VDLFVNYDCDLQAANLFERTLKGLARIARSGAPGPGMLHMVGPVVAPGAAAVVAQQQQPHLLAADMAVAVVRALDAWAEPLKVCARLLLAANSVIMVMECVMDTWDPTYMNDECEKGMLPALLLILSGTHSVHLHPILQVCLQSIRLDLKLIVLNVLSVSYQSEVNKECHILQESTTAAVVAAADEPCGEEPRLASLADQQLPGPAGAGGPAAAAAAAATGANGSADAAEEVARFGAAKERKHSLEAGIALFNQYALLA
jgi:hypothetical protein